MFRKFLFLVVLSIFLVSCTTPAVPTATLVEVKPGALPTETRIEVQPSATPPLTGCSEPEDLPVVNGKVAYKGISFQVDPALSGSVAVRTCAAVTLQSDPGAMETHPAYTSFFFPGFSRQNVDFQPELRVYEVTGDMTAYTFPLNMLPDLKAAAAQSSGPVTWYDHAPLHARQTLLSFTNGAGVRGLVQYMQDLFFYTNNGLTYEFNGLTQDGLYFVSFRHPVSVPFLMELTGPDPTTNLNPQAIAVPSWPSDYDQERVVIQAYNTEALSRLENMADTDTLPDLALLDALVQSLQVNQP